MEAVGTVRTLQEKKMCLGIPQEELGKRRRTKIKALFQNDSEVSDKGLQRN